MVAMPCVVVICMAHKGDAWSRACSGFHGQHNPQNFFSINSRDKTAHPRRQDKNEDGS